VSASDNQLSPISNSRPAKSSAYWHTGARDSRKAKSGDGLASGDHRQAGDRAGGRAGWAAEVTATI